MALTVFTIGHSNHPLERFLALLDGARIETVTDVRTAPASRHFPQFNKARLTATLAEHGIGYTFAGDALGGRPKDEKLWRDGRPDYRRMIETGAAQAALKQMRADAVAKPLAMMCSEKEPLDCHRTVLVSRRLAERGVAIEHLLADGGIRPHAEIEEALLGRAAAPDLFDDRATRLARAWVERERAMRRPR